MTPYSFPGLKSSNIDKLVASAFNISVDVMMIKTKKRDVALARFVVWYIKYKHYKVKVHKLSTTYLKDDQTIYHGIRTVQNLRESSKAFDKMLRNIELAS